MVVTVTNNVSSCQCRKTPARLFPNAIAILPLDSRQAFIAIARDCPYRNDVTEFHSCFAFAAMLGSPVNSQQEFKVPGSKFKETSGLIQR